MLQIDSFERKLSFDEHIQLFMFEQYKRKEKIEYDNWHLKESLIDEYNKGPDPAFEQYCVDYLIREKDEIDALKSRKVWDIEKPVIWSDRNRDSEYIRKLELSHRFEVYAESIFQAYGLDIGLFYGKDEQYNAGETKVGIEIKCDERSESTGNYYIEYQERLRNGGIWVNSGILKNDNTKYYFYGVIGKYSIFRRENLLEYYRKIVIDNRPPSNAHRKVQIDTSKGFLIPKTEVQKIRVLPSQVVREIRANINFVN